MSSDNIPTTEPEVLVAGETWEWKRTDISSDYPSDEWTLTYYFLLETGTTNFNIAATDSSGDYLVSKAAADTANYTAGKYLWQSFLTKDDEKILVDRGCLEVLQDFSAVTDDPRTHAQKVFDALKAVVEGRASRDVLETEINGKRIRRMSWSDLMDAYNHFKNLVKGECLEAANAENPGAVASARIIRHEFGNPE